MTLTHLFYIAVTLFLVSLAVNIVGFFWFKEESDDKDRAILRANKSDEQHFAYLKGAHDFADKRKQGASFYGHSYYDASLARNSYDNGYCEVHRLVNKYLARTPPDEREEHDDFVTGVIGKRDGLEIACGVNSEGKWAISSVEKVAILNEAVAKANKAALSETAHELKKALVYVGGVALRIFETAHDGDFSRIREHRDV